MKKTNTCLATAALLISLCGSAPVRSFSDVEPGQSGIESQGTFARLRSYVGKYPSDEQDPTNHFWNLPEIKQPLLKMLGHRDFNRLSGRSVHSVERAVKLHDNYLFAGNCQYHCCPCRNNLLIVDLRDDKMYAIFRDQVGRSRTEHVRWISAEGRNAMLPRELCKFIEMGVPEEGCGK
jgi:hypothetical protein